MGSIESREMDLHTRTPKAVLKTQGNKVKNVPLIRFLDFFIQETCPWFPKKKMVNLSSWDRLEKE